MFGESSSDVVGQRSPERMFDAILMTNSQVGTQNDLKPDAKRSLASALEVEKLHIKSVKENTFVGNSRGLDLVNLSLRLDTERALQNDKIVALNKTIAAQKTELDKTITTQRTELDTAIATQKTELDKTIMTQKTQQLTDRSHEERLRALSRSNDGYKLTRQRCLCTFKRYHFGKTTSSDEDIITYGNETVHGDAVFDASLYTQPGGREDTEVFEALYGLSPRDVARIEHEETIDILNTHAGVIGSKFKTGSETFFSLFWGFVEAFEESKFDESYLDGEDTKVTHVYWAFVKCVGTEAERPRKRKKRCY